MKLSKTTLAGGTAAVALTVTALTGDTSHTHLAAELVGAVALAFLGRHAADCPANCPGTDANRKPRPWQRDLFNALAVVVVTSALVLIFSGCTTANPTAGQGNPPAAAYVVSPKLALYSNAVDQVAQVIGPVTGTGPAPGMVAAGIFALIGAISAGIAKRKSTESAALAAGVVSAGPQAVQAVLDHAATGPSRPAVSAAIVKARAKRVAQAGSTPSTPSKNPVDATPQAG
jgi:hypothetical protein